MSESSIKETALLQNLWDERAASALAANPLDLLRYRSNLLGEDLRITNFGGGNTSSKFELPDPLTGEPRAGDGGEGQRRRSAIDRGGRIRRAVSRQARSARRRATAARPSRTRWSALYPLCAFGENRVAASIDTALHAFLPFPHVDHLHPDWAIALAASANGAAKLEEFNRAATAAASPGCRGSARASSSR